AHAEGAGRRSPLASAGGGALRVLSVHGLLLMTLVIVAVFSTLRLSTFLTSTNFQAIGQVRAPYALLALAFMIPLAANEFDLSVGFLAELGSIMVIGFQSRTGLSWEMACLLVILISAGVGLVNGVLVTKFRVSSFIATLGTGTFILGVSTWYTGGMQLFKPSYAHGFLVWSENAGGIPISVMVTLALGVVLWLGFEYLAIGRRLYVVGTNPRAAALIGIPVDRLKILSFVLSGAITGMAGCLLGSQLRMGQVGINAALLLPAFTGALLGSTSVRPGRVNVWGTLIATALLGITVSGLQLVGAEFYVEQLFNGAMLVVAVALAVFAAQRREVAAARRDRLRRLDVSGGGLAGGPVSSGDGDSSTGGRVMT
ncbi:MAG: ABC transporter permease, partial [Gaiellaceae bacterium]